MHPRTRTSSIAPASLASPARRSALVLALLAGMFATSANAAELIAIGGLSGHDLDRSAATAGALENGQPGNLLGGLGSVLAWAGGDIFLGLPDRGPNATPYNAGVSDTASYINRFQTLRLKLTPAEPSAPLPFELDPDLLDTTLLHAGQPLVYGAGGSFGLPGGAPARNAIDHTRYLTGRSDNFDPTTSSTSPRDGRLDPEGIRVSNDGSSVFVTDEYGPYVYRFNRKTGQRTGVYALPAAFAIVHKDANGDTEIAVNAVGRVSNKGMEGLAISPDGKALFGAMQSPLAQDGGVNAPYARIVRIDLETGATTQFAYPLTNIGTVAKPKYPTISEIVAINSHAFLVDERDGKGLGDNSVAVFKKLFRVDLSGANDVTGLEGASALAPHAVGKDLFLDLVAALGAHGIAPRGVPAKIEGLAFGADVSVGGVAKHTLWIANDNDFLGTVTDALHPAGVANPNLWFVFAVDDAELPGFVPQRLVHTGR